jgi:hypothetical protein
LNVLPFLGNIVDNLWNNSQDVFKDLLLTQARRSDFDSTNNKNVRSNSLNKLIWSFLCTCKIQHSNAYMLSRELSEFLPSNWISSYQRELVAFSHKHHVR